jgi:hypothetical protein
MKKFKKVKKLENPFNCIRCNKIYKEKELDIASPYLEDYCRFLGFCHIKCFDELSDEEQHEIAEIALFEGSTRKHRHKFYLKNIMGYK